MICYYEEVVAYWKNRAEALEKGIKNLRHYACLLCDEKNCDNCHERDKWCFDYDKFNS